MYFVTRVPSIKGMDSFENLLNTHLVFEESNTVGYFETLEEAKDSITSGGIDAIRYPHGYVVIEKIGSGLLPKCETISWYKYNEDSEQYDVMRDIEMVVVNHAEIG